MLSLYPLGHSVVLGTAGSGKTLLALLRAGYLSDARTSTSGRTLLVTFNNVLTKYLDHYARQSKNPLDVRTYHKFAFGYLNSRKRPVRRTLDNDKRETLLVSLISTFKKTRTTSRLSGLDTQFVLDEIDWIVDNGIRSKQDYLDADRMGREVGLTSALRSEIYSILERYREQRLTRYRTETDYLEIATLVSDAFADDSTSRFYRHIVIDEGQQFSPEMLRSLAAAIPADGSLTFFGDLVQQTRGVRTRTNWKSANLDVLERNVWKFEQNYRNSPEITAFALELALMPFYLEPDLVAPKNVLAAGSKPRVVRCRDYASETEYVVSRAIADANSKTVAILCRTKDDVNVVVRSLRQRKCGFTQIDRTMPCWVQSNGIFVGMYQASQGLEFDAVFMPYCSKDRLPSDRTVNQFGQVDAEAHDARLFYIAITRAKTELTMTFSKERTVLIPKDSSTVSRFKYDIR